MADNRGELKLVGLTSRPAWLESGFVSARTKIMLAIVTPIIALYLLLSGMCSPYRWGMYKSGWLEMSPITFYGRVVDLRNVPVADAKVEVSIIRVNIFFILGGNNWASDEKYEFVTDKDGRFSLSGYHGLSVTIRTIKKPGFVYHEYDNETAAFYYYHSAANYTPDPNRPALLRLRHNGE